MESHFQNPQPGHNHHVHSGHQPPPPPSLSPHLNQLTHLQLTGHFGHYHQHYQPPQQQQRTQMPLEYPVTAASNIEVPATYWPSPQGEQVLPLPKRRTVTGTVRGGAHRTSPEVQTRGSTEQPN
ncbi:velvet complex subunit B-like [Temnothorax curvispinosus]|uniref:Velvet complex subunit B-like n=1 Tax=Temnothorax curvispinosus TaxID=300111 RepID=A0A6J1PVZ8_9HYME|nr:velvet complex subunit B-like [Temnothorax curvispinosus]